MMTTSKDFIAGQNAEREDMCKLLRNEIKKKKDYMKRMGFTCVRSHELAGEIMALADLLYTISGEITCCDDVMTILDKK